MSASLVRQALDAANRGDVASTVQLVEDHGPSILLKQADEDYALQLDFMHGIHRVSRGWKPCAVLVAALRGHLTLLKRMHQLLGDSLWSAVSWDNSRIAHYAALGGQLHVLQWIRRISPKDLEVVNKNDWVISHSAAHGGSVDVLEWLVSLYGDKVVTRFNQAFSMNMADFAAWGGHVGALQWLQRGYPKLLENRLQVAQRSQSRAVDDWLSSEPDYSLSSRKDPLPEETPEALLKRIQELTDTSGLSMCGRHVARRHVLVLGNCLRQHGASTIRSLFLLDCGLTDDTVKDLVRFIANTDDSCVLRYVDLSYNSFSVFPMDPLVLSPYNVVDRLEIIALANTSVRNIPVSFLRNIIPFLRGLRRQATYIDRVCISVVGHGGHGKSTFINELWGQSLMANDHGFARPRLPKDLHAWRPHHVRMWCDNVGESAHVGKFLEHAKICGTMLTGSIDEVTKLLLTAQQSTAATHITVPTQFELLRLAHMVGTLQEEAKSTTAEARSFYSQTVGTRVVRHSVAFDSAIHASRWYSPPGMSPVLLFQPPEERKTSSEADEKSMNSSPAETAPSMPGTGSASSSGPSGPAADQTSSGQRSIRQPQRLQLTILDFAGQAEYYMSHKQVLPYQAMVTVLVGKLEMCSSGQLNVGKLIASFQHWLVLMSSSSGFSAGSKLPLFLVATHADTIPQLARHERHLRQRVAAMLLPYLHPNGPFLLFDGNSPTQSLPSSHDIKRTVNVARGRHQHLQSRGLQSFGAMLLPFLPNSLFGHSSPTQSQPSSQDSKPTSRVARGRGRHQPLQSRGLQSFAENALVLVDFGEQHSVDGIRLEIEEVARQEARRVVLAESTWRALTAVHNLAQQLNGPSLNAVAPDQDVSLYSTSHPSTSSSSSSFSLSFPSSEPSSGLPPISAPSSSPSPPSSSSSSSSLLMPLDPVQSTTAATTGSLVLPAQDVSDYILTEERRVVANPVQRIFNLQPEQLEHCFTYLQGIGSIRVIDDMAVLLPVEWLSRILGRLTERAFVAEEEDTLLPARCGGFVPCRSLQAPQGCALLGCSSVGQLTLLLDFLQSLHLVLQARDFASEPGVFLLPLLPALDADAVAAHRWSSVPLSPHSGTLGRLVVLTRNSEPMSFLTAAPGLMPRLQCRVIELADEVKGDRGFYMDAAQVLVTLFPSAQGSTSSTVASKACQLLCRVTPSGLEVVVQGWHPARLMDRVLCMTLDICAEFSGLKASVYALCYKCLGKGRSHRVCEVVAADEKEVTKLGLSNSGTRQVRPLRVGSTAALSMCTGQPLSRHTINLGTTASLDVGTSTTTDPANGSSTMWSDFKAKIVKDDLQDFFEVNPDFGYVYAPVSVPPTATKNTHYIIFLGHRGPDTKDVLAGPLHHCLTQLGVSCFLDIESMAPGTPDNVAAMQWACHNSALGLILFSTGFHTSPWTEVELNTFRWRMSMASEAAADVTTPPAACTVHPVFWHVQRDSAPADVKRIGSTCVLIPGEAVGKFILRVLHEVLGLPALQDFDCVAKAAKLLEADRAGGYVDIKSWLKAYEAAVCKRVVCARALDQISNI